MESTDALMTPEEAQQRVDELERRLRSRGDVWVLMFEQGYANWLPDDEDESVVPVWPTKGQAQECAIDGFEGYAPERLTFDEFRELLEALAQDELWVGMNLDCRLAGISVPAHDLLKQLADEERKGVGHQWGLPNSERVH